jgi:ABC-2 type transport system permease protein
MSTPESFTRGPQRGVGRGSHTELSAADVPPPTAAPHGGAPGYDPRRTLPLRVELRRQLGRRRTQITLGLLVVLPLLLVAAYKLGASPRGGGGNEITLADFATVGAANFTLFTIFASSSFLLVIVVALFCGDTVASEASWSSLRYLLLAPVGRSRLLRQKLTVALGLSGFALLLLPAVSLLAGWAAFGWHPVQSPTGSGLGSAAALLRLLLIIGYLAVSLLFVASLAFYAGVRTDAPLGAVGGAVLIVIVSSILDNVTALGGLRDWLPTHYSSAWLDALDPSVQWDSMLRGVLSSLVYSSVLFTLAWRHFLHKDVVS